MKMDLASPSISHGEYFLLLLTVLRKTDMANTFHIWFVVKRPSHSYDLENDHSEIERTYSITDTIRDGSAVAQW